MDGKFLTAGPDGKAVYEGEEIYSKFHQKFVNVTGIYVDCDGDVYLTSNGGTLLVTSMMRASEKRIRDAMEAKALKEIQDTLYASVYRSKTFD